MLTKEQKLDKLRAMATKSQAAAATGKGTVVLKFGSDLKPLEFIPSRIAELDQLCGSYTPGPDKEEVWTGNGGPVLRGRWTIWWGGKGCGKTTMALRQAAIDQEMGEVVGYFNAERALDPIWCVKQGVNLEDLIVWEGGNLEENLDSMISVLKQGLLDMIIIDTIHAFAPKADTVAGKKERKMEDAPPQGRLATKLSRFFRVATNSVANSECGVLLIGQARQSGDWEQLTGGHALLHYVSLNLHFTRIGGLKHPSLPVAKVQVGDKNETKPIGFVMKVKVDKTRVNHRDQDYVEIPFLWGLGPDNFEMNVLAAVKLGIIGKAGSFYTLPTAKGPVQLHGRAALMEWVRGNEEYYGWLMDTITEGYKEPEELKAEAVEEEPKVEKPKRKRKAKKK